jgi:hypothetical protein
MGTGEEVGAFQLSCTERDTPVPARLIAVEALPELLLAIVSWPDAADALVGSKLTFNEADFPDAIVRGKVNPETEKPVPVTLAELTTSEAEPVDESVRVCVAVELRTTLPKLMVVALALSTGPLPGCSFKA